MHMQPGLFPLSRRGTSGGAGASTTKGTSGGSSTPGGPSTTPPNRILTLRKWLSSVLAHISTFDPQKASQTLQQSCLATLALSGHTVRSAMGKSVVFAAESRGGIRGISAATFKGLTALALRLVKNAARLSLCNVYRPSILTPQTV